jgi:hypothetical protein
MAITSEGTNISLQTVIYEDEVLELRKILQELAPEELSFDMSDCDDIHLAVIQQILAYKKLYNCKYIFGDKMTNYQKIIEGFNTN